MNAAFIPLTSTIVSFAFGLAVLDQYFARRKPYQLVWAVGLFMYAVGTGTEFWTGFWGLNETIYRLWYLFGAIFVAAYMGMGTIYLLTKRQVAHTIMVALTMASLYATYLILTADIDISNLHGLSGVAMPTSIRSMTPIFNTFGTVGLVGGAAHSAWVYWRRHILPHRVVSNILIAVGAILPAFGGLHIRLGGGIELFYVSEFIGIIIMFVGFLRTKEVFGLYRFPLIHGFGKVEIDRSTRD
jgi:hypothetical protein